MSIDSPKNTERIKRVLNYSIQTPDSETCQGFAYLLSWAHYDMIQLKKPINIEAYEISDTKNTSPLNTNWDKKFKEKLEIWDQAVNNPKRIKTLEAEQNQSILEHEIEGAKSRYAINNEENLDGSVKVKFEDIRNYLSEFRGKEYKSLEELEQEARRKISTLGTYPTEENSFEGNPMEWGDPIN
jgi:hypothetical protein